MKRIAIVLAVAMLAAGAGTAAAGTTKQQRTSAAPLQAQINKLNATVKSLQATVKKLQADVKKNTANIEGLNAGVTIFMVCQDAVTADAFQGTWGIIDQILVASGKPAAWGPQTPVNDFTACSTLGGGLTHTITTPPTVANFSALITLLHG